MKLAYIPIAILELSKNNQNNKSIIEIMDYIICDPA